MKKNTKAKYLSFSKELKSIRFKNYFYAVGTPTARRGDGEGSKVCFQVCKDLSKFIDKKDKPIIVTKSTVPISAGKEIIKLFKKYCPNLQYKADYYVASIQNF